MQLTCPTCGQPIRAENINIQEMAAVCSNCNTVFQFNTPADKTKRRKVKQPSDLALRDAAKLEMRFRTNWRLGSNEQFIGFLIGSILMGFVAILMFNELLAGEVPFIIPLIMTTVSLALMYFAGLTAYNHTEIEMDEEKIIVSRKPLPTLFTPKKVITLQGVETIRCEETPISIKEGYDLPRFRVWAETPDGVRRMIINDVTEEYAFYLSQRMEEKLHSGSDIDVSHLEDAAYEDDQQLQDMNQAQSEADTH